MPPLSEDEQAQLAAMLMFQNYGVPAMANYNSQLNLFQDVMSTMADPTFLYLQGLLTDQEMIVRVEDLLFDPIDISEANWKQDYDTAVETGDSIVAEGMRLIQQGLKTPQVIVALRKRFADSFGDVPGASQDDLTNYEEVFREFEEKWNNAKDIESRIYSGEYIQGSDGSIFKPVDEETGRKRLEGAGLRGYSADPNNWSITPESKQEERGLQLLQQSQKLTEDRENLAKTAQKQATSAAQSVYKTFLNKTPEGRKALQYVSQPRKENKGLEIDPKKAAAYVASRAVGLPVDLALLGKAAVGKVFGGKDLGKQVAEQKAMMNQDYWAKLGASYAGRAVQDEKRKELERLDKEAEEKKVAGTAARQAARLAGSSPALDMMKIAPYFAAMAASQAQPEKKKTYVKPQPRTLSDAEIETMANMIAGGMA